MTLSATELEMNKFLTQQFILADAEEIVFSRVEKVSDGAKGFKKTSTPMDNPQTVRLIPQSDKVLELPTTDGRRKRPEFIIMGMPDLDIQRYDTFMYKGEKYEISQIHSGPDYEKKGDVILHAER